MSPRVKIDENLFKKIQFDNFITFYRFYEKSNTIEAVKVTLELPLALKIDPRGQNRPKTTMEFGQIWQNFSKNGCPPINFWGS